MMNNGKITRSLSDILDTDNMSIDTDLSIGNKIANNAIIEADNLDALHCVNSDTVDIIYIDPPYNTGKNVFTYNDNRDTSTWVDFMLPRLHEAKRVLSDTGVIFLSIDDNNYPALRMMCDSVFSVDNYAGTIIQNKQNAQNDKSGIQRNHEYIVTYYKNGTRGCIYNNCSSEKKVYEGPTGGYYYKNGNITTGGEGGTLNNRPTMGYTIYFNTSTFEFDAIVDYDIDTARYSNNLSDVYNIDTETSFRNLGYVPIRPPMKQDKLGAWTWGYSTFCENKDKILISERNGVYSVSKITSVDPKDVYFFGDLQYTTVMSKRATSSIVDFSTATGTRVLNKIFNRSRVFTNPKNHNMIKYLISLHPDKNAVVLDFFAGSGTTGHSVIEQNMDDGGHRSFVLINNNEADICRTVTRERISLVIDDVTDDEEDLICNVCYFKMKEVV